MSLEDTASLEASTRTVGLRPIVSVFSGAGGLDLGFERAGFRSIFASDNSQAAVNTFNANIGGADVAVNLDLLKTSTAKVVATIAERITEPGLVPIGLIGGPPCQGVSLANNYSEADDPRNRLFARYASLVLALESVYAMRFFVFENVLGLKQSKNLTLYNRLRQRLSARFDLHEAVIDASTLGVPQARKRLIIVGINKAHKGFSKFEFPAPHGAAKTVRDAIFGLPEPVYFSRTDVARSDFHENHWTMARKSIKFSGSSPLVTPANARSFVRLEWDRPSRTVAYGNREIHIHPNGLRRLSIFEAMLLQGFPATFRLLGNLSEQVTQVSNAVPPPVAQAIGEQIRRAIYD